MGCSSSQVPGVPTAKREGTWEQVEGRVGKVAVHGRYHRLPERFEDDYVFEDKVLGRGAFSVVKQASSKDDASRKFAVKSLKTKGLSKEDKEQLEMEVDVFLGMDHRNVVRLFDVYEEDHNMVLVMECMEGGELFDRIVEKKQFTEVDAAKAVNQMLLAVNYLHSNGCTHRDIKLENFLYTRVDSDHLKLIDFGFAKFCDPTMTMHNGCGTLSYIAPEVIKGRYTYKADVWSVGVIAFVLLAGYMPFDGENVRSDILQGKCIWKQEKWHGVSKEALQFVKSLLTVNPDNRPTAAEALADPWVVKREDKTKVQVDQGIVDSLKEYSSTSKFRRACMEMMAWSLSYEEREMVAKHFLAIDTEKTGTIKLSEFKQVMVEQFKISDEETQQIFEAMDSNNDQSIHYSDFLAAMLNTRIKLHSGLLRKAFRRFDKDNTGYISLENLQRVFGDKEDVSALLAEADLTMDGKISYKEFVAFLTKQPVSADEDTTAAFAKKASVRVIDKEMRRLSDRGVDMGQGTLSVNFAADGKLDLQGGTNFDSRQLSMMSSVTQATNFDTRQVSCASDPGWDANGPWSRLHSVDATAGPILEEAPTNLAAAAAGA